jgi:hypothetical protein
MTSKRVPAEIRAANGLLWAFDSLYVAVNDYEKKMDSGVYRLTDSNGDDQARPGREIEDFVYCRHAGIMGCMPSFSARTKNPST